MKSIESEVEFIITLHKKVTVNFKDVIESLHDSDNISGEAYQIAQIMYFNGKSKNIPKKESVDDGCGRTSVRSGC